MDEKTILNNVVQMSGIGITMLHMADAIQPYLDQAGIHREDWNRAAHWLMGVSDQLGPFFSHEVLAEVLKERLAALEELVKRANSVIDDRPDWNKIMEDWNRE